jgi:8-oxo-dGTP diphosphatase
MRDGFPGHSIVTGSLCYVLRTDDAISGDLSVLLLRRARPPQQGLWSAPGGKMEFGESPDECVIREIREETGLIIANPVLRAVMTIYDAEWPIQWLIFIYRTDEFSGGLRQGDEGELRWIRLDTLEDYKRPYADSQCWPHVIGDDPTVWRGKFTYHTPQTLLDEVAYPTR